MNSPIQDCNFEAGYCWIFPSKPGKKSWVLLMEKKRKKSPAVVVHQSTTIRTPSNAYNHQPSTIRTPSNVYNHQPTTISQNPQECLQLAVQRHHRFPCSAGSQRYKRGTGSPIGSMGRQGSSCGSTNQRSRLIFTWNHGGPKPEWLMMVNDG